MKYHLISCHPIPHFFVPWSNSYSTIVATSPQHLHDWFCRHSPLEISSALPFLHSLSALVSGAQLPLFPSCFLNFSHLYYEVLPNSLIEHKLYLNANFHMRTHIKWAVDSSLKELWGRPASLGSSPYNSFRGFCRLIFWSGSSFLDSMNIFLLGLVFHFDRAHSYSQPFG